MRSRNIKPGFFTNEDLVELPFEYRLLFQGLWMMADACGRLEDRPKRIKMNIFPVDNVDVESGLDALEKSSGQFIKRYTVNGTSIIQVRNFEKHQNPHINEKRKGSVFPECPDLVQDEYDASTIQESDQSGGILNPDILNPESGNLKPDAVAQQKTKLRIYSDFSDAFLKFWEEYPSKKRFDKDGCWKKWKAKGLEQKSDLIINAVKAYKNTDNWTKDDGQYIPGITTFVNQSRWEADIPIPAVGANKPSCPKPNDPDYDRKMANYLASIPVGFAEYKNRGN
jgi:hypothetical protein